MMMIKPILTAFALLGTAVTGWGAVPEKIAGFVYYENRRTLARSNSQFALTLTADGKVAGLYSAATGPAAGGPVTVSTQEGGTYAYTKLDEQTAELTLTFTVNGGDSFKRTLKFESDTTGFITVSSLPITISSASFRLVSAATRAPLTNVSNRSFVRADGTAITGFVINSGGSGTVLIRAVGPGLAAFGVSAPLRNPRLGLATGPSGTVVASNDDWSSESAPAITRTGELVGAFGLTANSLDAAIIRPLAAGAYTVQVTSPEAADTGEVLIEIYLLP
jgi:hypothetical protein